MVGGQALGFQAGIAGNPRIPTAPRQSESSRTTSLFTVTARIAVSGARVDKFRKPELAQTDPSNDNFSHA